MNRQDKRDEYRAKWESKDTTTEERIKILTDMQDMANQEGYDSTCIRCKELVILLPHNEAVGEGHIYSEAGINEYQITRLCEYCFDDITVEDEEEYSPEEDTLF